MSPGGSPRIFVLSSRPDILADVAHVAARLEEPVPVIALRGAAPEPTAEDLILVDVAEPKATAAYVRSRFGSGPDLIALIEGAWVPRLGDALAGDWDDYLFYPVNLDELGLVRRRHGASRDARTLGLDVDDRGRIHLVIPSDVGYQRPAVERIVEACRHLGHIDAETVFRLRVSLGEAVANAILYGSEEGAGGVVRLEASASPEGLRVEVKDEGEGFDPASIPDPTGGTGLEKSHGRGLFLLRQMCDEVRWNEKGNEVTLIYRGALDPVGRLEPWLREFSSLTELRFRLERERGEEVECLFDAWSEGGLAAPADMEAVRIGPDGTLLLEYEPVSGGGEGPGDRPLSLLKGWLGAVAESDEMRERLLERRMRRERVLAELEVARDLQLRLLPPPEDFSDLARVAARCEPALSLGGDFYYLARLPGGRLGVMLGDVSSHGPSAALIMALTLSTAAVVTAGEASPADALGALQGQLLGTLASTEMYMTLFYGVLDRAGTLTYANAGHPYAYRLSGAGAERLGALDPPLGVAPGSQWQERTVAWEAADTLVAFTDGLAESRDPFEVEGSVVRWGRDRGDPRAVVDALFDGSHEGVRLDDRTAIAVRW